MLSPDLQRIVHILDYCKDIESAMQRFGDSFDSFGNDIHYQQSVAFSIIQIAELSNGLSAAYKTNTSDRIPWARMKAMRNIVVHDYGNIDHNIVWETANLDIPALQRFCEEQLAAAEESEN